MSVSAPCDICGEADAEHTCSRCGQLVCEDHVDRELGHCVECAVEVGRPDDGVVRRDEDLPDGVDTYRY